MRIKFFTMLALGLAVALLSGCNHRLRMYSVDKPRVDQELPPGSDETGRKKTRKVYVFEMTKTTPETPAPTPTKEVTVKSGTDETASTEEEKTEKSEKLTDVEEKEKASKAEDQTKSFNSMNFAGSTGETQAKPKAEAGAFHSPIDLPADYTVEKDDTLQKIAKKYYGSYGKWIKIYNVNKERIPDPNRIKPGTKITLPKL